MADPATEHAALQGAQTGYQPTSVPTQTRNIQLANYAPMLQAIEQAGQSIINSPLNPQVRSQMQLATAGAQAGTQMIKQWANDPNQQWKLGLLGSVQGGQFNVAPGYTAPQSVRAMMAPSMGSQGGSNVNQNTVEPQNTQQTQQPDNSQQTQQPQQQTQQPQTNQPQPNTLSNPDFQFNTGQVSPQGAPNYFASNGGQQPPAAPDNRTAATAPSIAQVNPNLVASTNNDQLMRDYAAQKDAENQQNLVQWQNKNQGGVMSAVAAKQWAQQNLDTDISRAVYLPNGGPKGANGQAEPAYAFYGKHGGTNIVPVSQMVKAGAGPLVVAQNTSQVLNASDKQNQAAQQANQGLPGHIPFAPGQGPQTGAQPPAQQGPPPAPGGQQQPVSNVAGTPVNVPQTATGGTDWSKLPGQLPQDQFNQQVAAATNVTNAGGPPLNRLSASNNPNQAVATTDENGVPKAGYNNGQVNLSGNPDYVNQATGVTPEILNGMRNTYLKNGASGTNPNSGDVNDPDPKIGQTGDFSWYLSNGGKGLAYTVKPGQVPFTEQRLYEGSDHWEPFDPPQQVLQRNLMQWDPSLTPAQIQGMSKNEMQARLQEAYYIQKILPSKGEMQPGTQQNVDHLHDEILAATRVENAIKGLKPEQYGVTAQQGNTLARQGETMQTTQPHGPLGWFNNARAWLNGVVSGQGQENPKVSFIQDQWKNLEGLVRGRENEEQPFNQMGSTMGSTTFPTELHNWLNQRKLDYGRSVTGILANNQRIPGQYVDMANDLKVGKPWWDPADTYGEGSKVPMGNAAQAEHSALQNHGATPSPTPAPAAPGASPAPTGSPVKVATQQQYNALPVGAHYQDSTGRNFIKQAPRQQ